METTSLVKAARAQIERTRARRRTAAARARCMGATTACSGTPSSPCGQARRCTNTPALGKRRCRWQVIPGLSQDGRVIGEDFDARL